MSLALIHDKQYIKNFWEKKIDDDCHHSDNEEQRKAKSALNKLRAEWLVRLESRTKHLKNINDNYILKAKMAKTAEQI